MHYGQLTTPTTPTRVIRAGFIGESNVEYCRLSKLCGFIGLDAMSASNIADSSQQKTPAVLILQILQCLALIDLNQVNLTKASGTSSDDDNSELEGLTDLSWYVQLKR